MIKLKHIFILNKENTVNKNFHNADTMHERNMLMRQGYPRVKAHCRQIGYEFQVVDMRWGVRDEATDDHMGTELCLKELKLCQKLSTGPNFVVIFRRTIIINYFICIQIINIC